ncbi:hypothetical protein BJV78DRAFT_1075308, partial [Lactifluus subvellereus]
KRFRPKLTSAQKEARCKKLLGLTEDIDSARKVYQEAAHDIAEKHGRSQRWTRQQLFLGRLQHAKSRLELEVGKRYRLTEFLRKKGSSLRRQYRTLTMEEKNLLAKEIDVVREQRVKTRRANPKAVQRDVTTAFSSMEQTWISIISRTGIEGFYMAVRGSVEDYTEPKL